MSKINQNKIYQKIEKNCNMWKYGTKTVEYCKVINLKFNKKEPSDFFTYFFLTSKSVVAYAVASRSTFYNFSSDFFFFKDE